MRLGLLLTIFIFIVSGCVQNASDSEKIFGIEERSSSSDNNGSISVQDIHTIQIVSQGSTSQITSQLMAIGTTLSLKGIIVDFYGTYVTDVAVAWTVTGDFSSNDLSGMSGSSSINSTFTANQTGSGVIQATIVDTSIISTYNVTSTTTTTGLITVQPSTAPDEVLKISGDAQAAQVGTTLASTLKVQVRDMASNSIAGIPVTFAVASGGGVIVTAQPVFTDASGYAECTVKAGGLAGSATNSYTASISSGTTTSVAFSADSTAGPANKLALTLQPDGGNVGAALNSQPIVEIQDSYGNKVTTATNPVSATVTTGTGTISGTNPVNAVAGVATFAGLSYDTYESGVVWTFTSPGLTSAVSNAFDIGQIITEATCVSEGGGWQTTQGGCKDLTTGVVFSAVSASSYNWHQAVWDSTSAGSAAPDADDEGRTNDLQNSYVADSNAVAYCHDLVESGYSDWVIPRTNHYIQAGVNSGATKLKEVRVGGSAYTSYLHTGAGHTNGSSVYVYSNSALAQATTANTNAYGVRCVRYPAATQLVITTQPGAANVTVAGASRMNLGRGTNFQYQPVIAIRDITNSPRSIATNAVTVSVVGGTGTLSGTTTVNAVGGVATFTDLSYDTAETITLRFTSPGLSSVDSDPITIYSNYPKADCKNIAGSYTSGNGGCKDMASGVIYSHTVGSYSWHDAIWDSTTPGNAAQDSHDQGPDEYQNAAGGNPDTSLTNICKSLSLSGYEDWYLPYHTDLTTMSGKIPHLNLNLTFSVYQWTALTYSVDNTKAYALHVNSSSGGLTGNYNYSKTSALRVVCVRRDPPDHLKINVAPDGGSFGFGAGVPWAVQPVVAIVDADNSPIRKGGNTITMTLTAGSGSLLENGLAVSSITATTDDYGVATFSGVAYDTPGETITIQFASDDLTWKGSPISFTPITTDIVIPSSYSAASCRTELPGAWETRDGGCRDMQAGGLVWSARSANAISWYDAVWDSTIPGAEAADADDGGNTNDYDGFSQPAGGLASFNSYCHGLMENGYTDWRMPTLTEVRLGIGSTAYGWHGGHNYVGLPSSTYIWSSLTNSGNTSQAYMFRDTAGTNYGWYTKGYVGSYVRCVRTP